MIRTLWAYLVGVLATAYFSIGVNVHFFLGTRARHRFAQTAPARWGALLLRTAGVRAVWEHPEHLGQGRAQVLVANHQSWFDVFALAGTLPVRYSFVGKKELAGIPVFGTAWARVGHYAVDRSDYKASMASLREVGDRMKAEGATLVVFPEGTRSPTGKLARFKKGAFVLAIEAQVPIVPVAVLGSRRVLPRGGFRVAPGRITIRAAPPISTVGMTMADRDKLARMAQEAVANLMGQAGLRRRPADLGRPPAEAGTQVAKVEQQAAEVGTQVSEVGTQAAEAGAQAVEVGTQAPDFGQQVVGSGRRVAATARGPAEDPPHALPEVACRRS